MDSPNGLFHLNSSKIVNIHQRVHIFLTEISILYVWMVSGIGFHPLNVGIMYLGAKLDLVLHAKWWRWNFVILQLIRISKMSP